jgi:hypothetical protein
VSRSTAWYALCAVHLERERAHCDGSYGTFAGDVTEKLTCDVQGCARFAEFEWYPDIDQETVDTPVLTGRKPDGPDGSGS